MSNNTDIKFAVTGDSATVALKGAVHVIRRGSPNFLALRMALLEERWADVEGHLRMDTHIKQWAKGHFSIVDNNVCYDNVPISGDVSARIMEMASKNEDVNPLLKFWDRLKANPSHRSVTQLWTFLKNAGIPITQDGHFLAYKAVRTNFKDVHSGKFDNTPGNVIKMPRNEISDDPNLACHVGLHVGALEYASTFGGSDSRIVICKVDPADVVCVPFDASFMKMRVCKYEVIGHHNGYHMSSTTVDDEDMPDWERDDYDDYDDYDEYCDNCSDYVNDKQSTTPPGGGYGAPLKKSDIGDLSHDFDHMTYAELYQVSLDDLRKYARRHLNIVGASRLHGGKSALIDLIMKTL
jgi:hypothetical protein